MQTQTARSPKRRRHAVALATAACVLVALAAAFFAYTGVYSHAEDGALAAADAYAVSIEQKDGYIAVTPAMGAPAAGYVFYPGGKVQAEAYLPYLAEVAEAGYYCALLQVPLRLAVFDMDAAAGPIADNPGITAWAVGGHSLGGVAAASFAGKAGAGVQGLVLLASYSSGDLSASGLKVVSVTGTRDEVLDREKYDAAREKLPPDTEYVAIAGGNHSQFGRYGHQKGDGEAGIAPEAQQSQVAAATVGLLARLG